MRPFVVASPADIAQNVRELQREAEILGVFAAARIAAAEDFDAHEADDAGDAITIDAQVFPRGVARAVQVHLDTGDDFVEVRDGQRVLRDERADVGRERAVRSAHGSRRPRARHAIERGLFFDGITGLVREVIDHAAEGVEDRSIRASFARQRDEGEREIGFAVRA